MYVSAVHFLGSTANPSKKLSIRRLIMSLAIFQKENFSTNQVRLLQMLSLNESTNFNIHVSTMRGKGISSISLWFSPGNGMYAYQHLLLSIPPIGILLTGLPTKGNTSQHSGRQPRNTIRCSFQRSQTC